MEFAVIGRMLVLQKDQSGYVEPCIVHSEFGEIPGKCQGGSSCFPYNEEERYGIEFERIVGTEEKPIKLVINKGLGNPHGAIKGYQKDGAGEVYAAIANTEWGLIPGKAQDNTCWFPYAGKEYTTSDFYWIVRVRLAD